MCLGLFFFLNTNRKKGKGELQHLVALTSTGIVWSAFDSKYVECRNAHNIYAEIEMSYIFCFNFRWGNAMVQMLEDPVF